ncbi:MAG: hypothetical protein H0V66_12685, partial [Bdellovibrionales bacterium]|nr:hypothetical protein [Bdellovibrionales bacterium]
VGSLVYSAYSKLNPDSLVSLLNNQIQHNYPGSKLTIDKIDYVFSIDFKLSLKRLTLTRGSKTLASANEVQLKVPWWLILLNRGNASINVSDLTIFISGKPGDLVETESSTQLAPKTSSKIEVSLPQYLVDARYTLRAKNVSIKEFEGDRRFFTLSKLLVREFQYGKNSAFELNIPISITHKNKRYSSELWLFGDVTAQPKSWSIHYRGEFKTKEMAEGFQYEDLVIDGKSVFNPSTVDLTSTIQLLVDKQKVGTGEISAKMDHLKFHLKLSHFPMDFLNMIGDEIKNPYWKKIGGVGEGEVKFNRTFKHEHTSSLSAKLHFPGNFTLGPDHSIPGQWFLDFKNEIWETSFISPKQDLKFSRRAVLDFDKGLVTQYSQEIGFTGCDFKAALLAVQSLAGLMDPVPQPYHSTVVQIKQCLDGDKIFDGSFRFGIFPNQKYFQADLQDNQSSLLLKYTSKPSGEDFALDLVNFKWNLSYKFLEPFMSATEAVLDGKIEGKWKSHWTDGIWLVNLKADKIAKMSGEFHLLNQKMWDHFTLDANASTKKSWQASVNEKIIKINSLILDGADPAQLAGSLSSLPKAKSYLTLTYPKNRKWKPVKKEVTEVFWKKETL